MHVCFSCGTRFSLWGLHLLIIKSEKNSGRATIEFQKTSQAKACATKNSIDCNPQEGMARRESSRTREEKVRLAPR
jgi:hypothetical protein